MKYILFLGLFLSFTVFARGSYGPCSKWEESKYQSCTFNQQFTKVWVRQCTHIFDVESICTDQNPNNLESACTEWVKENGSTCFDGTKYEQSWIRSCTDSLNKTRVCLSDDPNEL